MEKLTTKKEINRLAWLFSITYMVSYITRINYGAVISEMVEATGYTKSMLSLAVTGSFITYGTGQIISGFAGDRIAPKKLVSWGLIVTVLMNCFIPLCTNQYQMLVVWCINGFAQAFMWPPLVVLMSTLLSEEEYKKATVKVTWGSSFGTIIVYLLTPIIISVSSWKGVFFVSAAFGLIMLLAWNKYAYNVPPAITKVSKEKKDEKKNSGSLKVMFSPLMIFVMIAIVLQGMLRDGVTTWMPSYISETYNLDNVISILTGVLLPIFGIISMQLSSLLYRKKFKNPIMCAGVIFGVGTAAALALYFFAEANPIVSVFFSALLTGCMHGVNLMLVCMLPPFFKKYGGVSTASGIINSCTYIGSAISTYGIAVISETFGWKTTLLIWLLVAVAGTLICIASVKPWDKKFGKDCA